MRHIANTDPAISPNRRKPIDPRAFAAIDPQSLYTPADVADLFRRHLDSILRLCRRGRIPTIRDPLDPRAYRIWGSTILEIAGPILATTTTAGPSESEAAREKRAKAKLEEIRRLAKAPQ